MLKNLIIKFNYNFEVPIFVITRSFKSNYQFFPTHLEISNKSILEVSVNELEGPSSILPTGKYVNYILNYSRRSAKNVQNCNSDLRSSPPGLLN